jgi:hypothetical protein
MIDKPFQIYVKTVFNVIDVILKFGNPKTKTRKIHMNNSPCNFFKNMLLGHKN